MELDVLEVLLRHGEHVARVGQEDVAAFLVLGHVLVFAFFEVFQFCGVVALYPAGLVEVDGFPAATGIILVLQTILDDLELQLADGADNLATVELVDKQLGDALVHQLVDALLQLLRLHGVVVLDVFEEFGRERGQSAEVQLLALGQRVADFEDAVVGQSDDVAGPCFVDGRLALGHELRGRRKAQRLALPDVQIGLVALELAAAHLTEGDARAVVGVDVGGYLEDESRELGLVGLHHALLGLGGLRAWGYLDEAVEQFLHAEVIKG